MYRRSLVVAAVLVLPLVAPVAGPASAAGATYYVSPSGADKAKVGACDSGGTSGDPWGSIERGLRCLAPGDTLILKGGDYFEEVTPVTTSGTASQPITVKAAAGERPVIHGVLWLRSDGSLSGFDHWTIDGVNVTYDAAKTGGLQWLVKFLGGRNWTFKNGEVWGQRNFGGLRVEGGGAAPVGEPANWVIRDSCIHTTVPTNAQGQDHNIYVETSLSAGSGLIENNIAFGATNGSNIKLGPNAANVVVRGNTFYDAWIGNILVSDNSRNITLERNLTARTTGKSFYRNIRGANQDGPNVVAVQNAAFDAAGGGPPIIYNDGNSAVGVIDGGANVFPVNPAFDDVSSCSGFNPTAPAAMPYGHDRMAVDRVFGGGRIETAVALSQEVFTNPAAVSTVLLSRSDQYPDALAGAPLAKMLGGPILLTTSTGLHPATLAEVQRLAPSKVYLLGGQAALSAQVETDLRTQAGISASNIIRVSGASRFDTAGDAGRLVGGTSVYVVEGANSNPSRGWPDAVSVASLAALEKKPILLTFKDTLPDGTKAALADLGVTEITVIGGAAAVSDQVLEALADYDDDGIDEATVTRVAGADRFSTSREVADLAVAAGANPDETWLAYGFNWPDALAAGPMVAATGGVFLLTPGDTLVGSATQGWVQSRAATMDRVVLIGGTGAVGQQVEADVAGILASA